MNDHGRELFRNIGFAISGNAVTLGVSFVAILIIPKMLGVPEYGQFQRYVFYSSYAYLLHLGWANGLYLRFGGKHYEGLDRPALGSQFWLLLGYQFLVSSFIAAAGFLSGSIGDGRGIALMVALAALFVVPRTFLQLILQATYLIESYSRILIVDRVIYLGLVIALIGLQIDEFEPYVIADLTAKVAGLGVATFYARDIVFSRWHRSFPHLKEAWRNIRAGSSVVLASLASTLVIGVVRFGSDLKWGAVEFGQLSLILSLTTFVVTFLNSVGLTIFPLLRRLNNDRIAEIYVQGGILLLLVLSLVLGASYPLQALATFWLPAYGDALKYLPVLLPLVLFEGRMSMLIIPYLQALRMERVLMIINLGVLVLSASLTWIAVFKLEVFGGAVFVIMLLTAVRASVAELVLSRKLKIAWFASLAPSVTVAAASILFNGFVGGKAGLVLYLVTLLGIVFALRSRIELAWRFVKNVLSGR